MSTTLLPALYVLRDAMSRNLGLSVRDHCRWDGDDGVMQSRVLAGVAAANWKCMEVDEFAAISERAESLAESLPAGYMELPKCLAACARAAAAALRGNVGAYAWAMDRAIDRRDMVRREGE